MSIEPTMFKDQPKRELTVSDVQIVVSTENTQYMAWQTQLFCSSAWHKLKQQPIVIVHTTDTPLRREFVDLERLGFFVVQAQSFAQHPGGRYLARNELGSLLTAASIPQVNAGHILFCESDMLFLAVPQCVLKASDCRGRRICGEYYEYLNYEQRRIRAAAAKFGMEAALSMLNSKAQIGVPYLLPRHLLKPVAERWIEVLDSFERMKWIDIMYAFGLAVQIEGVEIETTHRMVTNEEPHAEVSGDFIHYCYGDSTWDKRLFTERSPLEIDPNELPTASRTTVLGEIIQQIRHAREFLAEHKALAP